MILNDSSEIIQFSFQNIVNELEGYIGEDFEPEIRDYVKINDEYYYAKMVTSREMLNELIGTYYSNLIGLDAVQYKIGIFDGKLYALSKMFFKKDIGYVYCAEYFSPSLFFSTTNREIIKRKEFFFESGNLKRLNSDEAVKSILQMSAVDIKMSQADRHSFNIIIRIVNGVPYIEKVFDFGWAYDIYPDENNAVYYKNPFVIVKKDYISISMLADKHPEFGRCAAILSNAPVGDVLRDIESSFNIKVSDEDFKYYVDKDKEYTKILRKTL